jgi:hypothetical protein
MTEVNGFFFFFLVYLNVRFFFFGLVFELYIWS